MLQYEQVCVCSSVKQQQQGVEYYVGACQHGSFSVKCKTGERSERLRMILYIQQDDSAHTAEVHRV